VNFFAEGGKHFLQDAHSQGAIIAGLAARRTDKEIMKNIEFMGVAPATHMPKGLFGDAIHLESERDFVPGIERWLGGIQDSAPIISLAPHPEADFWDHSFDSPTYSEPMESHISEFLGKYGAN
nr:hypothetical protein [Parachlamydiaceae bacterium]